MPHPFEAVVLDCLTTLDAILGGVFPPRQPERWSHPAAISDFVLGFAEDGYFLRWACGSLVDGGVPPSGRFGPAFGREVRKRLALPPVPRSWAGQFEDDDDALDAWSDGWQPVMDGLHLLAGGLALHHLRQREQHPFAANCTVLLSRDLDNDVPVVCGDLLAVGDPALENHRDNVYRAWFAQAATSAWVKLLSRQQGDLSLPAIAIHAPTLPAMIAGARIIGEVREQPARKGRGPASD